jgi:hypothetical protein
MLSGLPGASVSESAYLTYQELAETNNIAFSLEWYKLLASQPSSVWMGVKRKMNVIARFFLRAKHWQIFLLLFGLCVVGDVAAPSSSTLATAQSLEEFGKLGLLFGVAMVLFMFCFLAWFWSMGSFLSSIVQPGLRLKMGFFRIALIYPVVYLPLFIVLIQKINHNPTLFAVIFPLHVFAMFCMFYLLYFVSKSLVSAETSKPASFYDYAAPFFLIWFFPIGVWFTQPRINLLYEERRYVEPHTEPTSG